jgi:hypothetical protein
MSLMIVPLLGLTSCGTTSSGLSTEELLSLPDEYKVTALALEEKDSVELPASGKRGFTVTITLNKALPEDKPAFVPYLVRDKELIQGQPLAVSVIGVGAGKASATRSNSFYMECDDGKVAGRTALPGEAYGKLEQYDRSSGERVTKIFVQYGEELRQILGITVGVVAAVESNRIHVSCPK